MKHQSFFIQGKVGMSEENRTPTKKLVEIGDFYQSGQSASEGQNNWQSQFLDGRMSSSEVDRRITRSLPP